MRKTIKLSFAVAVLTSGLCSPARVVLALDQAAVPIQAAPSVAAFQEFLQSLWPLAQQKGVTRATFDTAIRRT